MRTLGRNGLKAGIGASALLLLSGVYAVACQDTSNTGSTSGNTTSSGAGGGGGATPVSSFTPQGCGFSIAARAEYKEYTLSAPTNGATPNIRRVRLGLGGNVEGTTGRADPSTSIAVAWQTDDGTLASEIAWGADPDPSKWDAANRVSGVTWLTPQGDLNPNGDERMHEVYVCGLSPETTYYYRVGGGASGSEVWSDVYSFTTTPKAGLTKVTFGVTGDSRGQQNNAWQILQRQMHKIGPTMQLFSGDMINLAPDQGEWEEWLDHAWRDSDNKPLTLAQLLTVAAHGNHDNHTALFFGNMVLPQDNAKYPKYGELFFSMDVGPVHVVIIDDAWIVQPTGDQDYLGILQTWLTADLDAANKNRAKVPWIITMHHHPEYSSSVHGQDQDVLRGRKFFAPLWQQYHVDMAFSGHDHDYERSKPLNVGADVNSPTPTTTSDGTVYVVCAGSGADGYPSNTSTFTATSKQYESPAIGIYGILTADATTLKLEAHELHADASDPIFDTFTITK
jgi:hypothetical protein